MIRTVNNTIGLLFFIKDNFLKYSFKDDSIVKGSRKELEEKIAHSLNVIDPDILWITNIDNIPNHFPSNIKNYNFFNVSLKNIIQYYNIESVSTKIQFNKLIDFYQKLFFYFKEEYPNLSLSVDKMRNMDNFAEAFGRSEIKDNINIDFPWTYVEDMEIDFKGVEDDDYNMNGFFSYTKIVEILSNIKFPTGGIEIYDIDKERRIDKNNFSKISQLKDFAVIGKVAVSDNTNNKIGSGISIFESNDDKIITDFEIEYLLSVFDILPSKFVFFNESHSLKELVRLPFRLKKYNSFSYDIFCKNLLISIKNNNISILNFWMNRFERLYKLDKLIMFAQNNISITKSDLFEFKLSIKQDETNSADEKDDKRKIPFEIKQNKKLSSVSLLEDNSFFYLYKDYLNLKYKNKEDK